jgi:HAD superfamily hydrolase (TIGR01509 family)
VIDLSLYKLIIFDKDGTLIDFDAMWGGWVEALAERLEAATGQVLAGELFARLDYDADSRRTFAGGRLALTPMTGLFEFVAQFLVEHGLSLAEAEEVLQHSWFIPDPVSTARPLADLYRVFTVLREHGLKIAVATSDDRAPTLATLAKLGLGGLVDVVIAADDGVALKPAPDMVLAACRATGVAPQQTTVVGDAVPELAMARAAGAGLAIAVTSGVSSAEVLAPCADVVLASVADLIA